VEEQGAKIESLEKRMTQLESDLQTLSTKMDELAKETEAAKQAAEQTKEPTKQILK
jgi:outer membrane murein-binding lipoprotein Lpp